MNTTKTNAPSSDLSRRADWLSRYTPRLRVDELGTVVSVGDGVAWVAGLPSAAIDDILVFADGSQAVVLDLTRDLIGAVLLHETPQVTAGAQVRLTRGPLSIPVGDNLLGRVLDPLGVTLDELPAPSCTDRRALDLRSPPIISREAVHEPLLTGVKAIDTLVPIGKGQRQLLIGDSGLGRSALAIDSVINQRDKGVYCVYVLVGQRRSTVVATINTLREHGALDYCSVVVAEGSTLPGLQFYAPFAGCAIAEYWMNQGRDTLVVYDDLSTHANTYRELSLLLRRPPGREAYPGDVFSVHARLLERSTCLNTAHGGGSMTALPIVGTQQGEIAAYIPTNLISITDGQLYLDGELFAAGFRPAIDIARSVSRIGGAAQHARVKEEAARIKLDYLQFLELEAFTRFGARLDPAMERAIARGRILRECLKQDRLSPVTVEFQLAWLIAYNDELLDALDPSAIGSTLERLGQWLDSAELDLDSPRQQWRDALRRWAQTASN
ncbi:MAG: ATP F0F1 synthase subunit alpha [Gammaproteobacteria bacterium SG8_47]|nr:MAG: ATP F0F1 synthase subunit alpha [Gammaproteobacteria bacterium SG8_47]